MKVLDEQQIRISNREVDWAKHYDFYEVELRDMYKTVSKPQNDSHYEMLKSKGSRFLKKGGTFCEIGFSAGLTLRHGLKHFKMVCGLDISPKNVKLTEQELKSEGYSNFQLYTSDLMVFDERFKSKFDVISLIHGLEHFTSKDYPIIFKNIKKYLKPNGIFTGALPFKNRFNYRMCPQCHKIFEIDGHVSSHDINSLRNLFENNGFEIVHLNNFNTRHALMYGSFAKRLYNLFFYFLLRKNSKRQLEYIVRLKQ